ncbi:MAG: response regulator transcription factor [Caldilineaceae bacterium]|nr:response regulator transcription factor [Caldilineaceae bacterium]HRJ43022.1 response regulator transcription factor [Caldilineaceae bacterium]
MRILVVEDETRMQALLRQALEEESYAVDSVENGRDVFDWVSVYDYDLILLDVMLPGMDGFAVCKTLRQQQIDTPVLMLTARYTVDNRVEGLDSGADDYLVKPFAVEELLARVRALTRRQLSHRSPDLAVGDLTLDTLNRRVTRDGAQIELSAKEYMLLETLLRHPNQTLSRDQIINHVWDADYDAQSKIIEVYIHNLRRKLGDDDNSLIQTVRGLGYRVNGDKRD